MAIIKTAKNTNIYFSTFTSNKFSKRIQQRTKKIKAGDAALGTFAGTQEICFKHICILFKT
jgi:hypothetical protein